MENLKKIFGSNNLKILSFNINGLRSVLHKGFIPYLKEVSADIVFLSETKWHEASSLLELINIYPYQYFNPSDKKGYSSTALFSKKKPISVSSNLTEVPDGKGRCITAYFEKNICVVGLYSINAGENLKNLKNRIENFEFNLRIHISKILENKNIKLIITGDLNVAYLESDIDRPNEFRNIAAGFTNIERINFWKLLQLGLFDAYMIKNPDHLFAESLEEKKISYTYFSNRGKWIKGGLKGWRLDYFLVNEKLKNNILEFKIDQKNQLSDHVPIILKLSISKN